MALPTRQGGPAILGDEELPGFDAEPLDTEPEGEPGARAARPTRQVKLYNQLNLYDQLGDLFPEGKVIDIDPPISLANLKLNIYAIDLAAKDKRKARQLVDTVPPPLERETLQMTYGPGKYLIQALRSDNGQLVTQTTIEIEGEPREPAVAAQSFGSVDQAAMIAQAVAAAMAPVVQALQANKGQDKYLQLLEKIAVPQLTGGGGSDASTKKIVENALALQAETFKQQLALDRQRGSMNLKLEERKVERQWRKEDESVKFQQELMLRELEDRSPGEEDGIEPPATGNSVVALAKVVQESLGLKKLELFGGMDLGMFIEPLAGKLEKALADEGYHIVTKADLETMHESGRQLGFKEGQSATLSVAKKVRREIERGSNTGPGGGREGADDPNDRAGGLEGDTGSIDG